MTLMTSLCFKLPYVIDIRESNSDFLVPGDYYIARVHHNIHKRLLIDLFKEANVNLIYLP